MAIRQYIGARYVLKIYENSQNPQSADWESGVVYEPLVMVNYNNSSYISRKTVPANIGNPPSNPNYWALSGLYNGQIAALQQQINDVDDRVDMLEGQNKKIIFCGDSYAYPNPSITTFAEVFQTISGVTDFTNLAVNGAGFGISNNSFEHQIAGLAADPDVTDVIVCGGANDAHQLALGTITASNIRNGITSFVSTAKTKFPNATIYIGFVGSFDNKFAAKTVTEGYNFGAAIEYYYNTAAGDNKVIALKDIEFMLRNYAYMGTDGFHPNQNGMTVLGRALYHLWRGQKINYSGSRSFADMNLITGGTARFYELFSSSGAFFYFTNNIDINTQITPSAAADTWYDITTGITATGSHYLVGDPNDVWLVRAGVYYNDGGTLRNIFGSVEMRLNQGILQVRFYRSETVGKEITRLLLTPFSHNCNIDCR